MEVDGHVRVILITSGQEHADRHLSAARPLSCSVQEENKVSGKIDGQKSTPGPASKNHYWRGISLARGDRLIYWQLEFSV
jgi:hypothetical protein